MIFLDVKAVAQLAGITQRAMQLVCQTKMRENSSLWRGAELVVREIQAQGGNSGKQYEVLVSSLPSDLQARFKALSRADKDRLTPQQSDKAKIVADWRYTTLLPVFQTEKGSSARRDAVKFVSSQHHADWNGKPKRLSERIIYDLVSKYELYGLQGLKPKLRSDKGITRIVVSKVWDKAVAGRIPQDHQLEILDALKQQIRGYWSSNAAYRTVRLLSGEYLKTLTKAHGKRSGYYPSDADLKRICVLQPGMIYAEAHYRKVAELRTDRKKIADNAPYISRKVVGEEPMKYVVCDVHHLNVYIRREDGTDATPKLIAFLDWTTGRIFAGLVFFENRGGVINLDNIQTIKAMFKDTAFGVPQHIFGDNGSEYNFLDSLDDALQLNIRVRPKSELKNEISADRSLHRAIPYNARSKAIEAEFGRFSQAVLRPLTGYIGDDRMNMPTHQLGKKAKPFPGSIEEFQKLFYSLLEAYHHMPRGGQYGGKSAHEIFNHWVESGWQATVLSDNDMVGLWTKPETRVVDRGRISVGGRHFTNKWLRQYHQRKVIVNIPLYHAYNQVEIIDDNANRLCIADAVELVAPLDRRAAKLVASHKAEYMSSIRDMEKSIPEVDTIADLVAFGQAGHVAVPNEPVALLTINTNGNSRGLELVPESKSDDILNAEEQAREKEHLRLVDIQMMGKTIEDFEKKYKR